MAFADTLLQLEYLLFSKCLSSATMVNGASNLLVVFLGLASTAITSSASSVSATRTWVNLGVGYCRDGQHLVMQNYQKFTGQSLAQCKTYCDDAAGCVSITYAGSHSNGAGLCQLHGAANAPDSSWTLHSGGSAATTVTEASGNWPHYACWTTVLSNHQPPTTTEPEVCQRSTELGQRADGTEIWCYTLNGDQDSCEQSYKILDGKRRACMFNPDMATFSETRTGPGRCILEQKMAQFECGLLNDSSLVTLGLYTPPGLAPGQTSAQCLQQKAAAAANVNFAVDCSVDAGMGPTGPYRRLRGGN